MVDRPIQVDKVDARQGGRQFWNARVLTISLVLAVIAGLALWAWSGLAM